jgi:FlaG/FlaF family flagellin (archaellin)
MKKTTLLTFLISAAAASLCLAGDDAFMGTWKLNESKSKIPANTPHNNTVVYAQSGDEVTITGDGVDRAGKPVHQVWTGKFDGKDYPAKGAPTHDMRAYTKVDSNTLTYTLMKDGKNVGQGRVVVAADGKSRTVTETIPNADGKPVDGTYVFDKQ